MAYFFITAVITNILFGLALSGFFQYLGTKIKLRPVEIVVLSLGLAPGLTALILNYLLLFFPNNSSQFYVMSTTSFYLLLMLIFNRYMIEFIKNAVEELKNINRHFLAVSVLVVLLMTFMWSKIAISKPITAHDMLNYAVQGKMFWKFPNAEYTDHLYYPEYKFEYRGRHGFSFPLLLTWEFFLGDALNTTQDLYFSGIPAYYWFLILAITFIFLRRYSKTLSVLVPISLVLTPMFVGLLFFMGIDTFRIFFQICALIFTLLLIHENKLEHLLLVGIFGGIAANAHSIGVVLISIYIASYLLFGRGSLFVKIKNCVLLTTLVLVFGGAHYVLDLLFGTGWILTKIPS